MKTCLEGLTRDGPVIAYKPVSAVSAIKYAEDVFYSWYCLMCTQFKKTLCKSFSKCFDFKIFKKFFYVCFAHIYMHTYTHAPVCVGRGVLKKASDLLGLKLQNVVSLHVGTGN